MKKKLYEMEIGEHGTICALDTSYSIAERLSSLGFEVGGAVEKTMDSPLGGMSAYFILGSVIALRHSDARSVTVEDLL